MISQDDMETNVFYTTAAYSAKPTEFRIARDEPELRLDLTIVFGRGAISAQTRAKLANGMIRVFAWKPLLQEGTLGYGEMWRQDYNSLMLAPSVHDTARELLRVA